MGRGRAATFARFVDFLAAESVGLGADLATVKRLCADDKIAVDLIDRATANPEGRPASGSSPTDTDDNVLSKKRRSPTQASRRSAT